MSDWIDWRLSARPGMMTLTATKPTGRRPKSIEHGQCSQNHCGGRPTAAKHLILQNLKFLQHFAQFVLCSGRRTNLSEVMDSTRRPVIN